MGGDRQGQLSSRSFPAGEPPVLSQDLRVGGRRSGLSRNTRRLWGTSEALMERLFQKPVPRALAVAQPSQSDGNSMSVESKELDWMPPSSSDYQRDLLVGSLIPLSFCSHWFRGSQGPAIKLNVLCKR